MTAADLYLSLTGRGLTVRRRGGTLLVAPTAKIEAADRELIAAYKAALLGLVADELPDRGRDVEALPDALLPTWEQVESDAAAWDAVARDNRE